jgi:aquaporin Z
MNPARSLAADLVRADFHQLRPYLAGPTLGMLAAVGAAVILRGPGGDPDAIHAAQGGNTAP